MLAKITNRFNFDFHYFLTEGNVDTQQSIESQSKTTIENVASIDEFGCITVDPSCESNAETNETFIYCRVSRLDNGMNQYFLSRTSNIRVGDTVSVPTETGTAQGIVIAVETHSASDAPQEPEDTLWIID